MEEKIAPLKQARPNRLHIIRATLCFGAFDGSAYKMPAIPIVAVPGAPGIGIPPIVIPAVACLRPGIIVEPAVPIAASPTKRTLIEIEAFSVSPFVLGFKRTFGRQLQITQVLVFSIFVSNLNDCAKENFVIDCRPVEAAQPAWPFVCYRYDYLLCANCLSVCGTIASAGDAKDSEGLRGMRALILISRAAYNIGERQCPPFMC